MVRLSIALKIANTFKIQLSFILVLKKSDIYKNYDSKAFMGCLYIKSQRFKA